MNRSELCTFLLLPSDANAPLIRRAVARTLAPRVRIEGAGSGRRDELARRLGLPSTASAIAVQRVVESILARPLGGERVRTGVVDARAAMTLGELAATGVTFAELEASGITLGELSLRRVCGGRVANITRKFRNVWRWLVPGWLQTGQGEMVLFVQGMLKDAFAEAAHQTARLHYPSTCPSDALDFHGRSRALPRGLFEPEDNYRGRLAAWRYPEGHRTRGTAGAMLAQFQLALRGTHHVIVDAKNKRTIAGSGAALPAVWDWDAAPSSQWGRYWLVCKSVGAPWPSFTDPGWLAAWGDLNATWAGSGIASGELDAVLKLASNRSLGWTPAGVRGVELVLYFGADPFPVPTGNWDSWANRSANYRYALNESVS